MGTLRRVGTLGAPPDGPAAGQDPTEIARLSGPPGVRLIAGFHDEALAGKWNGSRSSRLGDQWRVIYRVVSEQLTYYIESVTPHDYRRP